MNRILEGRVALITGGSRGLGAAIAKRYAIEGAKVILVASDINSLRGIDEEMKDVGESPTLAQLDLKNYEAIGEFTSMLETKFGKINILVSNAAIVGAIKPLNKYSIEDWNNTISTNLNANWCLIKTLHDKLDKSGNGRSIFLSSKIAQSPENYPYWGAYAASKAALEAMVKVYAAETKHTKLCVNIVSPAFIVNDKVYEGQNNDPDATSSHPLANYTDKVISLFTYLASAQCNVTGQTYVITENDLYLNDE